MRRDLRELVEARAVVRLEHVDEVGDEVFVEHQAVAEHLEGVLARVGIGGRLVRLPGGSGRLLRLRRAAERHAREERAGEVLLMEAVEQAVRQRVARCAGAAAHEVRHADVFQRGLQAHRALLGRFAAEGNALGRGECTLAQGVHVFEVKVAKLHRDAPKFQK